jgi:ESX secretion system ATPase EccB
MERAVAYGDIHAEGESPRAQSMSLMAGAVLAIIAVAISAALAVWRPQSETGDAAIVLVRDSGALYVRVHDLLHPVLNLTSARLIAGTGEDPRPVTEASLTAGSFAGTDRGALLGIPGAPPVIGTPLTELESRWTVCDRGTTTVIAGPLRNGAVFGRQAADEAVLAAGPSRATFLLYGGVRARVDLAEVAVARALRIENLAPLPVSQVLLDMFPEVAPITAPVIVGVGAPGPIALAGFTIGEVVQVHQADGVTFYVVLAGGVQRIGQLTADLIRHNGPSPAVTAVAPVLINQLPLLGALPVETFPERIAAIEGQAVDGRAARTLCASWHAGSTDLLVSGGLPLTAEQLPARLARADGAGPLTDAVYLPAGRSAYVRPDGTRATGGSIITESGVRFPVGDAEAARILALPEVAVAAPRAVLEALPLGPRLTRSAALTAYDAVPAGSP